MFNGDTGSPGTTAIFVILLVIVLVIALNLRKKIPRNEDSGDPFFRRNILNIVAEDEEGADEEGEGVDIVAEEAGEGESEEGTDEEGEGIDIVAEEDDEGESEEGEED